MQKKAYSKIKRKMKVNAFFTKIQRKNKGGIVAKRPGSKSIMPAIQIINEKSQLNPVKVTP